MLRNGKWKSYMESTAVLLLFYSFYSAPLLSCVILVYTLLYTSLWPLVLLYLAWMYMDRHTPSTTGRRSKYLRNISIWKHAQDYFPQRLVKTADLDPCENYLFCLFPHGIMATGGWCHFSNDTSSVSENFPGLTVTGLTLNMNFYIPLFRDITLGRGLMSVSRESIENQLRSGKGKILIIAPGGAREAAITEPNKYRLVLKNRKGFVKVAIVTGTLLVPVIMFGENDLFDHRIPNRDSFLERVMTFIRRMTGVSLCLFRGCGPLGLLPYRRPVTTVVGKPIAVTKDENPSREEVNRVHDLFVKSITQLFEENKAKYMDNSESIHLSIED